MKEDMMGKSFGISEDTNSVFSLELSEVLTKFEKDVYYKTGQVKKYKSKFPDINSSS